MRKKLVADSTKRNARNIVQIHSYPSEDKIISDEQG